MIKSVFAKYVITFMALLLVSFLLLLFIVNSVVNNTAVRTEQTDIMGVASASAEGLSELFVLSGHDDLAAFIRHSEEDPTHVGVGIRRLLSAVLTNFEDMTVYVTDERGGFLFSTGKFAELAPALGTPLLTEADVALLRDNESAPETEHRIPAASTDHRRVNGIFLDDHSLMKDGPSFLFLQPVTLPDGTAAGYILVSSTAETSGNMMNATLRSMVVAGLWILLAALIAIYFITERVIAPMRDMSRAAKRMAVGQFDVRVPVRGSDEVAELAVAFNQMAGALENLERMRNTFVANVSHDLRTPMTTIAGFIDGILDGVIPPDQHTHYLQVVSAEVRRLSRLVTALLDVSRLQAGDRKFDMKPFDVCEMGRQILISFEKKIDDKSLDVEFDCDEDRMFVLADRDAIHQILYNICDNAIKFSVEGGKLRMSFTWASPEGSRRRKAVVKVYNEGQGIPPEDLPFVFERFYKSDKSRSLDKSGVGLGMFISKTIIDAHKESITVTSEYGKNCEFTFTLTQTEPPLPKNRTSHAQGGTP